MAARFQDFLRGFKVTVVGRGDAGKVDARFQELVDGGVTGETLEGMEFLAGSLAIGCGAFAGFGGDGDQGYGDVSEAAVVDAVAMGLFEEGAVGFVKDHAHADHAGSERGGIRHGRAFHGGDNLWMRFLFQDGGFVGMRQAPAFTLSPKRGERGDRRGKSCRRIG